MEYIKWGGGFWLIYKFFAWALQQERLYDDLELNRKLEAKREKDDAIRLEIEVVESAYNALPDIDAAMTILKSRYAWRDILKSIGIYDTHLSLLKKIYYSQPLQISLPDMQSSTYGDDEWRVIKNARKNYERYDLYYKMSFLEECDLFGIESIAQEPTVSTLVELNRYVNTNVPITYERKSYICKLNQRGEALIRLNGEHNTDYLGSDIKYPPITQVCSKINSVLYTSLNLLENSETVALEKSE